MCYHIAFIPHCLADIFLMRMGVHQFFTKYFGMFDKNDIYIKFIIQMFLKITINKTMRCSTIDYH